MKPLILKLTAFGPYKNTEKIDFNKLNGNNLYVISGNTGAGKTTIFDGICFALYGSASGTDREDMKMLRSHFADDDTHTAVELTFILNNRIYRVLRQMGHVKAGNKTRTGERYEFFEQTDSGEVPCVERQIVSEIDRKIESLIGLNQDQFKQIVMLPQGEFRKLLTSSTENKEEILRRLFKTDRYQQLNDVLKDRLDHAHEALLKFIQQKEHYIQQIQGMIPERNESLLFTTLNSEHYNVNQILDGLHQESNYYSEKIIENQKVRDHAQTAFDLKQTAYIHAQHINERFKERDELEAQLKEHISKKAEFERFKKQLARAEKASQIEPFEEHANEIELELSNKNEQYKKDKEILLDCKTKLITDEKTYKIEEANSDKRQKTYLLLERLNEQLPIVDQLQYNKKNVLNLQKVHEQLINSLESENTRFIEKQNKLNKIKNRVKTESHVPEQHYEKSLQLNAMRDKAKILKDYKTIIDKDVTFKKIYMKADEEYRETKKRYEFMENTWLNNQASELANHLHDGESCPVCGSLDHPNKAEINSSNTITRSKLDHVRIELNEKQHIYHEAQTTFNINTKQIEEKLETLIENNLEKKDALNYDSFIEEGKQLKTEVDTLEKRKVALVELKQKESLEENTYNTLDSEIRTLTERVSNAELQFKQAESIYLEKLKTIPKELQDLDRFKQELKDTKSYYDSLELAWKKAQDTYYETKNQHTKAQVNQEHLKESLSQLSKKHTNAQEVFSTKLTEAQFEDNIAYDLSKIPASKQEELKKKIEEFNQKLQTLNERISGLNEELKVQQHRDLEKMKASVEELKRIAEQALNELNLSIKHAEEITELTKQIIQVSENESNSEKDRSSIQNLYDTIRGQNKYKLSLERYLQIEYLEQIIDACNQRLRTLSNGQFYLVHSERQETRGKQSGLALDIEDSLTGERRDVKTMSGGEKFNASLCLALGMSDVIQSFQGNISIDTLFIDEGFGSLDEESLENATKILIDLQETGRTIGVISHVQELKRILPATLQVRKTKDGYSTTEFIINN